MLAKEYELYKSISKTAKENNLFLVDNIKRLFDFSLLDDMDISEQEKEVIKADIIHITVTNRVSFYGEVFDNFTACDGVADYCVHRVFSVKGKHLYDIFQLASVEHGSKKRQSVYERKYDVNTCKVSVGYTKPINEIEIA